MSTNSIGGDIFDSRDIEKRIEELERSLAEAEENGTEPDEDEQDELARLDVFRDEVSSSEWRSGVTFIRDDYFTEYAEQLADDIGLMNGNRTWPFDCIDWPAAAEALKADYRDVELDGVTYWYRG